MGDEHAKLKSKAPYSETLGKYRACHQCRKRKMKCDARHPVCSTCTRSYHYARLRSKNRESFPAAPDCTYDDYPGEDLEIPDMLDEDKDAEADALEARIANLEIMLKNQGNEIPRLIELKNHELHQAPSVSNLLVGSRLDYFSPCIIEEIDYVKHLSISQTPISLTKYNTIFFNTRTEDYDSDESEQTAILNPDPLQELFTFTWPSRIPHPELLHHLVDVFFNCCPHATRLIHRPSFETCIALSPYSPDFPKASLIHAICARASFHTTYVDPPQPRTYPTDETGNPLGDLCHQPDKLSFGERQALFATESMMKAVLSPDAGLQALQALIIISRFDTANARFVRSWTNSGTAVSLAVTWNLEQDSAFSTRQRTYESPFPSLCPPRDTITEEIRRNCFWLTYCHDRLHIRGGGATWNQLLNDSCISQVLPATESEFRRAVTSPAQTRQRIDSPDLFTRHDPLHTDSFVLYVKSIILLSSVKEFNLRYRSTLPPREELHKAHGPLSILSSSAFQRKRDSIISFANTFPKPYRDPMKSGSLDVILYMATILPSVCMILLYSPQIVESNPQCPATEQVLASAHRILNSVCILINTSCDLTLLDPFTSTCWLTAAKEMASVATVRAQAGRLDDARLLRLELDVFFEAFRRMAQRLPIADRHSITLKDYVYAELDPLLKEQRVTDLPDATGYTDILELIS